MKTLAPITDMWPNYPKTTDKAEVASLVGGSIGANITKYDWETCCIRLSRALNYSARPISDFGRMKNPYMDGGKVRAGKGADEKWYIYSCYDLRVYLTGTYGRPKAFHGGFDASKLSDVQGIIMFAFRHVDLWNGSEVRYNKDFTDGTKTVSEVLVWETAS